MAKIKSSILLIVGLILGYTIAAFQVKATKLKIAVNTDHPDTVYVFKDSLKHDTIKIMGTSTDDKWHNSKINTAVQYADELIYKLKHK